ncbi:DUF2101 family protein [Thermococcus sp.]|uniref:DUF2101 family protein n=1 Tax=Thermococcus sp. TaxID=35749 RepID=UPI002607892D|nr:DUF2101 family protein [Thermococcus sp.]
MTIDEILYTIGAVIEGAGKRLYSALLTFFLPRPRKSPPSFRLLQRLVRKNVTVHEFISLELQLTLLLYLLISLLIVVLMRNLWIFGLVTVFIFLALRYMLVSKRDFIIGFSAYRFFYCGLFFISAGAFGGYLLLRAHVRGVYHYYSYLLTTLVAVIAFRQYFRSRYGRDYTYGIVEEVKNDLIRVFVHDDIGANVKPGHYWVPAVPDAEPGGIVKLLVEERAMRSSVPVRILEVHLDQSSQTETEPKEEAE